MNKIKLSQIKADARKHLQNNYTISIECILIYFFILFFISYIQLSFSTNQLGLQSIISFFAIYLLNVVMTKLTFGLKGFYIKLCCHQSCKITDLFDCLFKSTDKSTPVVLIICLIKLFFSLIAIFFLSHYDMSTTRGLYVSLFVLILNVFTNLYIDILFMPVGFLVHDIKDKTARQLLSLSIWLMKGYKCKLFLLYLSFIPLFILGLLPCGIGLLWIYPYFYSTQACLYLKLTQAKSNIQ